MVKKYYWFFVIDKYRQKGNKQKYYLCILKREGKHNYSDGNRVGGISDKILKFYNSELKEL